MHGKRNEMLHFCFTQSVKYNLIFVYLFKIYFETNYFNDYLI